MNSTPYVIRTIIGSAKRNFFRIPLFCGGRFLADVQKVKAIRFWDSFHFLDTARFSAVIQLLDGGRFLADVQKVKAIRFWDSFHFLDIACLLHNINTMDPFLLLNSNRIMDKNNIISAAKKSEKSTPHVGGQAVIEGVMMRSPDAVAVAVRGPDGKIVLKRDRIRPWTKKAKVLALPFIRGGVVLFESLVLGVRALNFSSAVAMREVGRGKGKTDGTSSDALVIGTVVVAFAAGLALFFYLPLKLTEWLGVRNGTAFNLVDGGIRLVIFLSYLGLISLWKEMRRIFEYHGAEHKSIFAFEAGRPLTLRGVRAFSTHHPRCGTSFLLVVMLVSIAVFIPLGRPDSVTERLVRFLFLPVIGGVSYEIIKLSGSKHGKPLARLLVAPGLWLQRITTREPDAAQLEVALAALKSSLNLEVGSGVKRTSAS